MQQTELTSQITFLYFEDMQLAEDFFGTLLGLEKNCDFGWAKTWRIGKSAFIGAVDSAQSTLRSASKDGVLVSFVTDRLEELHHRVSSHYTATPIEEVRGLGFRSFFFTGPHGYSFEIQQFDSLNLRSAFAVQ